MVPQAMSPVRRFCLCVAVALALCAAEGIRTAEAAGNPSGGKIPKGLDRRLHVVRTQPMGGDLDEILQRRMVRVLVVHSRTFYFFDGARPRGITHELLEEFEKFLNGKFRTGKHSPIRVLPIPVRRDELIPRLANGYADISVANLTITPERKERVAFSTPVMTGVSELVVTGPAASPLGKPEDLAGKEVHVRRSSSYYESLKGLNERRPPAGFFPPSPGRPAGFHPSSHVLDTRGMVCITFMCSVYTCRRRQYGGGPGRAREPDR